MSEPSGKWSITRTSDENVCVQVFTATGVPAATITFDQDAAEEFVDALRLVVVPKGGPMAGPCSTCVREGGPYRCCRHCSDDPAAHESGQRDHHDLPCSTCIRRAAQAAR